MQQVRVEVTYVDRLPGGLPALWEEEFACSGVAIRLCLLAGMSQEMGDHFRHMAVRHALPDMTFDSFTVVNEACIVAAIA